MDYIGCLYEVERLKSLKECSDEEIVILFQKALQEIRRSPDQYGIIRTEVSGGKVKFLTVEKPVG